MPKTNRTPAGLTPDDIAALQAFAAAQPDPYEVTFGESGKGEISAQLFQPVPTFMAPDYTIVRTSPDSIDVSVSCFDWAEADDFGGTFATMDEALTELRTVNDDTATLRAPE